MNYIYKYNITYNLIYTFTYTLYYILYYIIWGCPTYPTHPYTMRYINPYIKWVQLISILIIIRAPTPLTPTTPPTHLRTQPLAAVYVYIYIKGGTATYMLFPSGSQRSHSPSTEGVARYKKMPAVKF